MASSPLVDMLGKLNHVAIATPDIEKASQFYRNLGANVSEKVVSLYQSKYSNPHSMITGSARTRRVYGLRYSSQFKD